MISVPKELHLIRDQVDALIHVESGHTGINKSVILESAPVVFL